MMDQPTSREIMDAVIDLRDAVAAGFARVPTRVEMNERFDQVDTRFERVDRRLGNFVVNASRSIVLRNRLRTGIRHPSSA